MIAERRSSSSSIFSSLGPQLPAQGSSTLGKAVSCPSLWNLLSLLPSMLRGMPDLLLSGCTLDFSPQEPGKLTRVPLHWECLPYSLSYVLKAFSGGSSVELIGSLNETTCVTFMAQHWPHQQIAAVIILTALRLVRTCLVRDSNKELILRYLV